jgi:adenosylcobinamide-phosphate synthase
MPMTIESGLLTGVALDALTGDPRRGHPVAAFGRAATTLERRLYADSKARGTLFTTTCILATTALALAADRAARGTADLGSTATAASRTGSGRGAGRAASAVSRADLRSADRAVSAPVIWAGRSADRRTLVTAVATWAVLGGTSLAREGLAMAEALEAADLEAARARLPHLCGRDPSALDVKELTRATVESIAENTSDAAVAPLLWGAALGVPGLLAYRAINTLDAMVGHRSPRYANFGWAAARTDDVANWVPARVTGLLTAACAPLVGGSPREAYAAFRRDGAKHPSPNAGRCEAAFAGALGVRLGGVNVYGTRVEHRPELGDGRAPEVPDIRRAVRLSRAVALASALLATGTRLAVKRLIREAPRATGQSLVGWGR